MAPRRSAPPSPPASLPVPRVAGPSEGGPPAPDWATRYRAGDYPPFAYTADVTGLTLSGDGADLEALLVERGQEPYAGLDAWPGGFVQWAEDDTAREAALREALEESGYGVAPRYLETLDTYDQNGRDPRQFVPNDRGVRVISKAFLALLDRQVPLTAGDDARRAFYASVYDFLPWEDLRSTAGQRARATLARWLTHTWAAAAPSGAERHERRQRIQTLFATSDAAPWNEERAPERLALLAEARVLPESRRDVWGAVRELPPGGAGAALGPRVAGRPLAFDHRQMLADALGRLRGKVKYVPAVLAALVGTPFTMPRLHTAMEAVAGRPIHLSNLRRLVVEGHALAAALAADHPVSVAFRRQLPPSPGRAPVVYEWADASAQRRLDPSLRMPWLALP